MEKVVLAFAAVVVAIPVVLLPASAQTDTAKPAAGSTSGQDATQGIKDDLMSSKWEITYASMTGRPDVIQSVRFEPANAGLKGVFSAPRFSDWSLLFEVNANGDVTYTTDRGNSVVIRRNSEGGYSGISTAPTGGTAKVTLKKAPG